MKASFGQNLQESETDGKCGASESTEGFPLWLRSFGEGHGTHSSILAWRIPGTEKPGGLQSIGVAKSQTQLNRLGTQACSDTYVTELM